ncbi:hypothetical protein [Streptomyces cavernae]|uniref:hypothetical protein n=1 Tax=Streptomyces cavernae TaxID=2259034 RepID=UPI000FEB799D|nr:hypothetical protein [Streptomyces cavernae]
MILDLPARRRPRSRTGLARVDRTAIDAALDILAGELDALIVNDAQIYDTLIGYAAGHTDWSAVKPTLSRLAARTGRDSDDPLSQIAATALLGL